MLVAHRPTSASGMGERQLDERPLAGEAAHVDVLDPAEPRQGALERREGGEISERAGLELDATLEALLVLGAVHPRESGERGLRRGRKLGLRQRDRLRLQDGLALLHALDGIVEVADDASHRLHERVAQVQQLVDLAGDGLGAQVRLGARARRLLLRVGEDRAGGRLGGELDLAHALLRGVEGLLDLGLAGAPAVELDPCLAQLGLDAGAHARASPRDPPGRGAPSGEAPRAPPRPACGGTRAGTRRSR